jgi:hypothetical protein
VRISGPRYQELNESHLVDLQKAEENLGEDGAIARPAKGDGNAPLAKPYK